MSDDTKKEERANKRLNMRQIRDCPMFRADLQIRTTLGLGWVGEKS